MIMIRTRLISALTVGLLLLAACGFTPLHSPQIGGAIAPMKISFDNTQAIGLTGDKVEFTMRQALNDRMATGTEQYNLSLQSDLRRSTVGITADDIDSRYDIKLNVKYVLTDAATGKIMLRDSVSTLSTFSAPSDPYGLTTAQSNAQERVAIQAVDLLILDIARFLKTAQKPESSL